MDISFRHGGFGRRCRWGFAPVFAPVCDGEAPLAPAVQAHPGQEMRGDVLRFDPRAGAHFSLPSLIEGHVPLATSPVVPVDH